MNIQEYINMMKTIQQTLLEFIDNTEKTEENFQNLNNLLNEHKIREDRQLLKSFLILLLKIANNHYQPPNFFDKIGSILLNFKDDIKNFFTNFEIFEIFKRNKRILLLLIEENIMSIDKRITTIITNNKFKQESYPQYFFTEIKPFVSKNLIRRIEREIPNNFYEQRKRGTNEAFVAQIIRNDSLDQFIEYINKSRPHLSLINQSIFETNAFLIKYHPTLIQYAAFYGSSKIFQFLRQSNVQITPSIWLYAIHGKSREIFNIIDEMMITPTDKTFEQCLKEAVRCHHIEIAKFIIKEKLSKQTETANRKSNYNNNLFSYCYHYYNFELFPDDYTNKFIFFYSCQYGHYKIVDILLKEKKINLKSTVISILFILMK